MGSYDWMELQSLTAEIATSRSRLVAARKTRDMGRVRALEEEISAAEARRERLLAHITTNLVGGPEPPPPNVKAATAEAPAPQPAPPAAATEEVAAIDAAPAEEPPPAEATEEGASADAAPAEEPPPARAAKGAAVAEATPSEPAPEPPAEAIEEAAQAEAAAPPPPADAEVEPSADRGATTQAPPPAAARKAARAQGGFNVWDQLTPSDLERAKRDLDTRRAETLARHAEELKALEVDRAQLDGLEQAISIFLQKFTGQPEAAGVVKLDAERELRQQGAS